MPLTIEDRWLPARATSPSLTNAEFADLVRHPADPFFETTVPREPIALPPNQSGTGTGNVRITALDEGSLCPDFVVDLSSPNDPLTVLQRIGSSRK